MKAWHIAGAASLAVSAVGGLALYQSAREPVLEIFIYDLPGSPAVFIRTPGDRRILVNGGSNSEIMRHLTAVLPFYSRRLDMIVAAEPLGKAVGGLIDVIGRYDVGEAIIARTPFPESGGVFAAFERSIEEKRLKVREAFAGERIELGDGVFADVLFPERPRDFEYSRSSAPQIILRIVYRDSSFLLLGHATPKVQRAVAAKAGRTDAVISFASPSEANMAKELIADVRPRQLIYRAAKEPEKPVAAPSILHDDRYNIKKTGALRLRSDGRGIEIGYVR